tara:strand:- start:143 stop:400 length:258 start_codon:yes stop_codon:yes gene_type:complete
MNETNPSTNPTDLLDNSNNTENIFIYIMLGIELLNSIIAIWASYKLNHIALSFEHVKCCCLEFSGFYLESESNEEKVKHDCSKSR